MFLEFAEGRLSFPDTDRRLMTLSAPVGDPARDDEDRGLIGDRCVQRIDLEDVRSGLAAEDRVGKFSWG